jgi:hypothetical protein
MRARKVAAVSNSRAVYNSIRQAGVISTPSYLRLEKTLGTQSNLAFSVLQNEGSANVTEKRLSISDTFTVTGIGVFLGHHASADDVSEMALHTYPNSAVFGSGKIDELQTFYNGFLSIRINQTVFLDSYDTQRHYAVGSAQEGVAISANATVNLYQKSTWEGGNYGFQAVTPTLTLSGAAKNDVQLTFPASKDMTPTSGTNYAVIIFRGFLNQNAAKFNAKF